MAVNDGWQLQKVLGIAFLNDAYCGYEFDIVLS